MLFIYFHVKPYSQWIPIHLSKSYQKHLVSSSHLKGRRCARSPSGFPAQRLLPGQRRESGAGASAICGAAAEPCPGPSGPAPPGNTRPGFLTAPSPPGVLTGDRTFGGSEAPRLGPASRNRSRSSPTAADMSSL